jgi:hypothetical protein
VIFEDIFVAITESIPIRKLFNEKILTPIIPKDKETFITLIGSFKTTVDIIEGALEE